VPFVFSLRSGSVLNVVNARSADRGGDQSMKNTEEFVPNERLRRARSLKGWSQAELAEQVGTSFEIVSRWERGITVPSPY
jgi:ribosome-binding protein aMBF1 (putative translation factor)